MVVKKHDCPKCQSYCLIEKEFPTCVQCGYIDYSVKSFLDQVDHFPDQFRGNIHVIPYDGFNEKLNNRGLKIIITGASTNNPQAIGNTLITPECTFCDNRMKLFRSTRNNIAVKKKDNMTYYQFACLEKHTVWITLDKKFSWH